MILFALLSLPFLPFNFLPFASSSPLPLFVHKFNFNAFCHRSFSSFTPFPPPSFTPSSLPLRILLQCPHYPAFPYAYPRLLPNLFLHSLLLSFSYFPSFLPKSPLYPTFSSAYPLLLPIFFLYSLPSFTISLHSRILHLSSSKLNAPLSHILRLFSASTLCLSSFLLLSFKFKVAPLFCFPCLELEGPRVGTTLGSSRRKKSSENPSPLYA